MEDHPIHPILRSSHSCQTCPKMGQDPKWVCSILPSRQIQTNQIPCQTCLNCLSPSLPKWVRSIHPKWVRSIR